MIKIISSNVGRYRQTTIERQWEQKRPTMGTMGISVRQKKYLIFEEV